MAEGGLDEFEMEELGNKYPPPPPEYDGETFDEVDNTDDLEGLLERYHTKHSDLEDIFNNEKGKTGKRLRRNKDALDVVEKKIRYAEWREARKKTDSIIER